MQRITTAAIWLTFVGLALFPSVALADRHTGTCPTEERIFTENTEVDGPREWRPADPTAIERICRVFNRIRASVRVNADACGRIVGLIATCVGLEEGIVQVCGTVTTAAVDLLFALCPPP